MNKVLLKRIGLILLILLVIGLIILFTINSYVKYKTKDFIKESKEITDNDYDCILVLGAGLRNGKPSPVLEDRLKIAIELYNEGKAPKIIMSGDHHKKSYDEVNAMKEYAINAGISSEDVFMDHAGFSTYDSIYRAKAIFGANKVIIVSQKFHLYRGLYIAEKLGIDAIGVSATLRHYQGETGFELREVLARNKDFVKTIFKPKPTYLGESIPVSGNGDITNDQ